MTLTFYTNFINHHQVPLADEFYKLLGDNYVLVVREPLPDEFREKGYADYSDRPYLLKAYLDDEHYKKACELATTSDVVILGDAPESLIAERLAKNKITFHYNERWIKDVGRYLLRPRTWINWYRYHTRYRNKNSFMLAASAYTKTDISLVFAYPNKCYKWGYFNFIPPLDIKKVVAEKPEGTINILWCGTMCECKHPELVIQLAKELKAKEYDFHINMIGTGVKEVEVSQMMDELDVRDKVSLLGNIPNEEVLNRMRKHHIFIFTSDRGEGWGVVLNEAMSNGCPVVASNLIGAAPFLIKKAITGSFFKSGSAKSLTEKVEELMNNKELRDTMAINAYNRMLNEWSPKVAAHNFLKLVSEIQNKEKNTIMEGPCSNAYYVNPRKLI